MIRRTILLLRYLLLDNGLLCSTTLCSQIPEEKESRTNARGGTDMEVRRKPAPAGPGAVEPRLARASLLPPSGSRALGRQRAARAGLSPARPAARVATVPAAPLAGSCAAGAVTGSVFTGMDARHLRGKKEELWLICNALEHLTEDISSAVSDLALETLYVLQALQSEPYSIFQRLQDQLRRAWRTRPRLSGLGWLRCWSSAEC
ncbi:uncharacterized protein LOC131571906 [Ammospiza caudacuta]|uniref:uncharacterized protein LOC131571906 n=1 Tax=Ammospiza caudacuta TaxID=2857398 RepID=UPI002738B97E|nr:uncharacterized protein LOC131571906 [Ammospiza caudacuta]